MKRSPAEEQRLKAEYDAYITELRKELAKKYGEQLSFDFEGIEEQNASQGN